MKPQKIRSVPEHLHMFKAKTAHAVAQSQMLTAAWGIMQLK
jgi:hypothetical protein